MNKVLVSLLMWSCSVAFATQAPDLRQTTIEIVGEDGEVHFEPVIFENKKGVAYYEGDIILGKTEDVLYGSYKSKGSKTDITPFGFYTTITGQKWPDGKVPYVFASSLTADQRTTIRNYMTYLESVARVKFTTRVSESAYLSIKPTASASICGSSFVGKQGGAQDVLIGVSCFTESTIVHELLHALGFWHEQSRSDRDTYITINTANVHPDYVYNFEKKTSNVATHGAYDFSSIMHYSPYAFSINGLPTISAKVGSPVISGNQMTNGDKAALVHLYGEPYVQPYVTYAERDWFRCNRMQVSWDPVESGLTYQLEQLLVSGWSQIYSGTVAFKSGIVGTPGVTTSYRVRALKNSVPGSWFNFDEAPNPDACQPL